MTAKPDTTKANVRMNPYRPSASSLMLSPTKPYSVHPSGLATCAIRRQSGPSIEMS
jgi:hypothetical protein